MQLADSHWQLASRFAAAKPSTEKGRKTRQLLTGNGDGQLLIALLTS